ncbi:MAG: restriction endonuclease [Bacteroidota bacterium]
MNKLTASNIVAFIKQLNHSNTFNYINPKTKGLIKIISIDGAEGPIRIKRWNPSKGETEKDKKIESISSELIWRIANSFAIDYPINFDRILGGSYNTRSVLEALLAHTPQFYFCYPGRIENTGGNTKIKSGHKHLLWLPDKPHKNGVIQEIKTEKVVSEIPSLDVIYDSIVLPVYDNKTKIDLEIKRRHSQIQVALYFIGRQLNFSTWIAQGDKGIVYQDKKIGEYEGVVYSLNEVAQMSAFEGAVKAALHIDCIWFKNGKLLPAVMEVEHSTGVTSGLSRMKDLYNCIPGTKTRYVIVASDDDREDVFKKARKEQFKELDVKYFSYSAVEELFSLCKRRKLKGVTDEFLDCFMEPVLMN